MTIQSQAQQQQAPGPQRVDPTILGRASPQSARVELNPSSGAISGQSQHVQFGKSSAMSEEREQVILSEKARIQETIGRPIDEEFEKQKDPLKAVGHVTETGVYVPVVGDFIKESDLGRPDKIDVDWAIRDVMYDMGNFEIPGVKSISVRGGGIASKVQEWLGETSDTYNKNAYELAKAEYYAMIAQQEAYQQDAYNKAIEESNRLTQEEKDIIDFYNSSGRGGVFGSPDEFNSADYTIADLQRAQSELGEAVGEFKAYSRSKENIGEIETWNKMVDDLVTKSDVRIDPADHYAYDKMRAAAAGEKATFQEAQFNIHPEAFLPDWIYDARAEGRQAVLQGKRAGAAQDFGDLFTPDSYIRRFEEYGDKYGEKALSEFLGGGTIESAAKFMGEGQDVGRAVQSRSVFYIGTEPYFFTSYGRHGYEVRDSIGQIRSAGTGDVPAEYVLKEMEKIRDKPTSRIISPTANVLYSDVAEKYPKGGEPESIFSSYDALFNPDKSIQVGIGALSRYTDTGVSTVEGATEVQNIAGRIAAINKKDRDLHVQMQDIRESMENFISQHPGTTIDKRSGDIAVKRGLLAPYLIGTTYGNPNFPMAFRDDFIEAGGESLARAWWAWENPSEYLKNDNFVDYSITMPILTRIGERRESVTSGKLFDPITTPIVTGAEQIVRGHVVQLPESIRVGIGQIIRGHEPITRDLKTLGGEIYEGASAIPFSVAGFAVSIPTGIEYIGSRTLSGGIAGGVGAAKTGGKTVIDSTIEAFSKKPVATAIEMYGAGKIITPMVGAVPVKPALHTAKFGDVSFYSLGLMRSVGKVDTAYPVIGLRTVSKPKTTVTKPTKPTSPSKPTEYPTGDYYPALPDEPGWGVFVGRPKMRDVQTAFDRLGDTPIEYFTPFETEIVARAISEERAKIDLVRAIRAETQYSGLRPRDMRGVIEEVVQQHGIPNHRQVADTILKTLVEDESTVYGSIVQRQIGAEIDQPGLLRVPRDIDAMVTDIDVFGKLIVRRINKNAGHEVVEFKDGAVVVKKTGEKLFDLHAKDAIDPTMPGELPSKWISLGIQKEAPIKIGYRFKDGTRGNLITTTLSEQATRKAQGATFTASAKPRTMTSEVTGDVTGRIMPTYEGRLKDIGDYYVAEKMNLAKMGMKRGSVGKIKKIDIKLETWLESWGGDVATKVRAQYTDVVTAAGGKTTLASFSRPMGGTALPTFPRITVPISGSQSPARSLAPRLPRVTVPRSPAIKISPARSLSPSPTRSHSPSPSPSRSSSRSPSPSSTRSPSPSPFRSPSRSPSPSPFRSSPSPSVSLSASLSRSLSPSPSPSRSPSPSPSPSRSPSRSPTRSPSRSPSPSPSPSLTIRSPSPAILKPKKSDMLDKRSKLKRRGTFSNLRTEWNVALPETVFFGVKKGRKGNKTTTRGV